MQCYSSNFLIKRSQSFVQAYLCSTESKGISVQLLMTRGLKLNLQHKNN